MNNVAIHEIIRSLEVRNVQTANSFNRQLNHLIGSTRCPRALQAFSLGAERAEDSCAIKPLSFAMGTEAHGMDSTGMLRRARPRRTSGMEGTAWRTPAASDVEPRVAIDHQGLSTVSRSHFSIMAATAMLFFSSISMWPFPFMPTSGSRMKSTRDTPACLR